MNAIPTLAHVCIPTAKYKTVTQITAEAKIAIENFTLFLFHFT